uniref:Uncharacterized protein n=1 Tax=Glossina palpalis gambiensis TaxID=67801 RepID=A0A1B0BWS7_9MUSC
MKSLIFEAMSYGDVGRKSAKHTAIDQQLPYDGRLRRLVGYSKKDLRIRKVLNGRAKSEEIIKEHHKGAREEQLSITETVKETQRKFQYDSGTLRGKETKT